ncbi:hypothetical protein LAC81_12610 [Ensifer adhaerens]|uniref:hypothetical protein n=1 Tax=Ensifer adhaerens TaxID=106592 RepID=UPI001CBE3943|nr:hypothetical protein [Ensifer adhaerens]MBZ7922630.1 hypothetical protein [Ensifer adhaerens]UAX91247.1 hypothetical protein LAC78_12605 [Ensifer adhaerens]UAX98875.1 hypothetical protein LAC80_12610 [Ensifer adhaerens]UAY06258.1 hypothetical protein LAC81_12610 [Ensifer adhaerens]
MPVLSRIGRQAIVIGALRGCREKIWLDILARFPELRRDVRGNARLGSIVEKYVLCPGLLPRKQRFHRKALLTFLDRFEDRVRMLSEGHRYLLICGICCATRRSPDAGHLTDEGIPTLFRSYRTRFNPRFRREDR